MAVKGLMSDVHASDGIVLHSVVHAVLLWHFIELHCVILWHLCITD